MRPQRLAVFSCAMVFSSAALAQATLTASALNNGTGTSSANGVTLVASVGHAIAHGTSGAGSVTLNGGLMPIVLAASGSGPVNLVSVTSRKTHGAAGTFNLNVLRGVPIGGAISVEPRAIGAGHLIVFTFDSAISQPGTATVTGPASEPLGSASVSFSGNEVRVLIANLPDNRRVNVALAGVNGSSSAQAAIGFLIGDFNDSKSVNATDVSAVKGRSGRFIDADTFRYDVNASGTISAADIAATKVRAGTNMP
ncbi:MAG: hypothetical protein JNK75_11130 [Betaproteobacteria bacterium]|nr:hypothetical protein [Betaproteobacteria bacterium]